ncbi:MAG: hypothetical protein AAFO75_08745, partial [Pseudomonadota bacterium]
MSIRSLPLIVFAFILYFVVVLFGELLGFSGTPTEILNTQVFSLPSIRGGEDAPNWQFTWGDLLLLITLVLLFVE